ncbi:DUF2264 domain-containing protein [Opitutus terrae]|uniref:DUF2264 domain-containing protein n=1 Tax=Opitutus terrae (strain DSM 11246 / JCM 15787 / PB90-1) TaxID=452637 RepID=B1ZPV8_OPITP|nr:DUF2264 domain-containing protein [Opitutus terrae]ACB75561.1 conserved hypothetical protein [Opitutus terrae PB90-1]
MSSRIKILLGSLLSPVLLAAADLPPVGGDGPAQRAYQVAVLARIAEPVLVAGSEGRLRVRIPQIEGARNQYAPLEALGRTLAGIAPWLELGPGDDAEGALRAHHIGLAVKSIAHAVDPQSPGHLNFTEGGQPLVDTAFLAQALLRAPRQLWGNLSDAERAHVVAALKATRAIKPYESNWLLFSAMVEAALLEFTGECELAPIERAVTRHLEWYKGDGTYGDGPEFHWDYYNSFVIHPMLWEVLEVAGRKNLPLGQHFALEQKRAQRYAEVLERMISPEGTFPIIGRSSAYRFGALHALSMMALRHHLPETVTPAGVRAALTAVIQRMIEAPGAFDDAGWLRIGVVGAQPKAAEVYVNTGSLYLCTFGLLQLGLPAEDPFWTEPNQSWTQQRLWAGENLPADHAIKE